MTIYLVNSSKPRVGSGILVLKAIKRDTRGVNRSTCQYKEMEAVLKENGDGVIIPTK